MVDRTFQAYFESDPADSQLDNPELRQALSQAWQRVKDLPKLDTPDLIPETFAFNPAMIQEPWPAAESSGHLLADKPFYLWVRDMSYSRGHPIPAQVSDVCFVEVRPTYDPSMPDSSTVDILGRECSWFSLGDLRPCIQSSPGYFCHVQLGQSGKQSDSSRRHEQPTLLVLVRTLVTSEHYLGQPAP